MSTLYSAGCLAGRSSERKRSRVVWVILAFFTSLSIFCSQAATAPGPDAFGYSVSQAPFSFTDLTLAYPGNGSRRVLQFDDDNSITVDIGFNFNFYGFNYSNIWLTPNGLLSFGGANTAYSNVDLRISVPGTNLPCIAVLWDDWETESEGPANRGVYCHVTGTPGNRQFIVQWNNVQAILDNDPVTFEAVLFEGSNEILLSYLDVVISDNLSYGNGAYATVGIRDVDGQINNRNLQWSYNQALVPNGLTLLISHTNYPPIASADSASTDEDVPVVINVLSNDLDLDGSILSVSSVSLPANGTAGIVGGSSVAYTPNTNFSGSDTFTYTMTDGQGGSATASVLIEVRPVNDPPAAWEDTYTVNEDEVLSMPPPGVLGNDLDPENDAITVVWNTLPAHGSLVISSNGAFTYLAHTNFFGTDFFNYRTGDGLCTSGVARVTITVFPVNEPPIPGTDWFDTYENTPLLLTTGSLLANDQDPDGTFLNLERVTSTNGAIITFNWTSGRISYTPPTNFIGTNSFEYLIRDADGSSAVGLGCVRVWPFLRIVSAVHTNGNLVAVGQGIPARSYAFEVSTNLVNWSELTTQSAGPTGALQFSDPETTNYLLRVFRLRQK